MVDVFFPPSLPFLLCVGLWRACRQWGHLGRYVCSCNKFKIAQFVRVVRVDVVGAWSLLCRHRLAYASSYRQVRHSRSACTVLSSRPPSPLGTHPPSFSSPRLAQLSLCTTREGQRQREGIWIFFVALNQLVVLLPDCKLHSVFLLSSHCGCPYKTRVYN